MMKHKYHEHVKYPMTSDELAVLMDPWTRAGFPGCVVVIVVVRHQARVRNHHGE